MEIEVGPLRMLADAAAEFLESPARVLGESQMCLLGTIAHFALDARPSKREEKEIVSWLKRDLAPVELLDRAFAYIRVWDDSEIIRQLADMLFKQYFRHVAKLLFGPEPYINEPAVASMTTELPMVFDACPPLKRQMLGAIEIQKALS